MSTGRKVTIKCDCRSICTSRNVPKKAKKSPTKSKHEIVLKSNKLQLHECKKVTDFIFLSFTRILEVDSINILQMPWNNNEALSRHFLHSHESRQHVCKQSVIFIYIRTQSISYLRKYWIVSNNVIDKLIFYESNWCLSTFSVWLCVSVEHSVTVAIILTQL